MNIRNLVLTIIALSFIVSCNNDNPTNPTPDKSIVTIGSQVWMLKNLNVDHYRNGDPIPNVSEVNLQTGSWCYNSNSDSLGKIYGKLYNWYAVNDPRGLAPSGWHVPSDSEWTTLSAYLGGDSLAGGKLKETGIYYWVSPNKGATNESGFSALPGGCRTNDGRFNLVGENADWWSATESNTSIAWHTYVGYNGTLIQRSEISKGMGFSVRCVKDKP